MFFLSQNLKKYRILKNLTQEDIAEYLNITPQSVSKWERGECYPDITFLPALANILGTSIDLLIGMDTIRAEQTRYTIHKNATELEKQGDYPAAEKLYRDALLIYPNKPGMILGLAGVLALQGKTEEAIEYMEKGLPLSNNEKQKATSQRRPLPVVPEMWENRKSRGLSFHSSPYKGKPGSDSADDPAVYRKRTN